MEHRSVQRFPVSLPITFYWGSNNVFSKGNGTSRDISTHGVFILTPETVVEGSDIWLRFSVPPIRKGAMVSEMQGFGHIVRVQSDGFAAEAAIGFSNHANRNKHQMTKRFFSGEPDETECAAKVVPIGGN